MRFVKDLTRIDRLQVGPSIWLGRVWVSKPIQNLNPQNLTPEAREIIQYLENVENSTLHWAATASGVKSQYLQAKEHNKIYFTTLACPTVCSCKNTVV